MATTREQLISSVLSAVSLKELQPDWSDAVIEEWLNFLSNLILLSTVIDENIDLKLEEVPTDFLDGAIPFVVSGFLASSPDINWDNTAKILALAGSLSVSGDIKGLNRAKQYFFAGL